MDDFQLAVELVHKIYLLRMGGLVYSPYEYVDLSGMVFENGVLCDWWLREMQTIRACRRTIAYLDDLWPAWRVVAKRKKKPDAAYLDCCSFIQASWHDPNGASKGCVGGPSHHHLQQGAGHALSGMLPSGQTTPKHCDVVGLVVGGGGDQPPPPPPPPPPPEDDEDTHWPPTLRQRIQWKEQRRGPYDSHDARSRRRRSADAVAMKRRKKRTRILLLGK